MISKQSCSTILIKPGLVPVMVLTGITLLLQYSYRHARYNITVTILLHMCPVLHYTNHTFTLLLKIFYSIAWYYITVSILLQV